MSDGSAVVSPVLLDQFDFELPPDRIALRPSRPRDAARLLCVSSGAQSTFADKLVSDLPGLLRLGDGLVFNDTAVIKAGLKGTRRRGETVAAISVTLHRRIDARRWLAFARPAKYLAEGDRILFGGDARTRAGSSMWSRVEERGPEGEVMLAFDIEGPALDEAIAAHGTMPLPPYIASRRPADKRDLADYQTVFAARKGAVAAPTAGLHFTPSLMRALEARGITCHFVTLHVGAGTFLPVKTADVDAHNMRSEWGEVTLETAQALNTVRARGRLVAVGTTALRLIESATRGDGAIEAYSGETGLFIRPGYRFKAVDQLITNFHLPRSTLFMLVAAFSGLELMKRAYTHAIGGGYRFYSYGDACLLRPSQEGT